MSRTAGILKRWTSLPWTPSPFIILKEAWCHQRHENPSEDAGPNVTTSSIRFPKADASPKITDNKERIAVRSRPKRHAGSQHCWRSQSRGNRPRGTHQRTPVQFKEILSRDHMMVLSINSLWPTRVKEAATYEDYPKRSRARLSLTGLFGLSLIASMMSKGYSLTNEATLSNPCSQMMSESKITARPATMLFHHHWDVSWPIRPVVALPENGQVPNQ